MPKSNKTDQLRVRLTPEEKKTLEDLIIRRGKNETISDLIREALAWCLTPGQIREPINLSYDLRQKVNSIAKDLNRGEDQVIENCIQGILDLIEQPDRKLPLIVLELQLRRQYESGQKDKADSSKKPKISKTVV